MSLFKSIAGFLSRNRASEPRAERGLSARGILVFHDTSEVIRAEAALKRAGLDVQVKGPPPALRTGCDLVIEFPLIMEPTARQVLDAVRLKPIQAVPVQDVLLEPVSLFHVKDFGDWLMVRAANMKITVDKASRVIVNISGGGCPDVPYLAERLVGRTIEDAPEPLSLGHTLCGYALQMAFAEARDRCRG